MPRKKATPEEKPAETPKPKGKPGRKPKAPQEPVAAAEAPKRTVRYNSPIDDEARRLFLDNLPKVAKAKKAIADATNALRNVLKAAKADGFSKHDFEVAERIQRAEGERELEVAMHRDLIIARWMGSELGAKADFFENDVASRVQDSAYDEGKMASMQGHTAKPGDHGYDPGTEGYTAYMKGYHDDQGKRLKNGIKPLDPQVQAERNQQVFMDEAEAARQLDIEDAFERGEPVAEAQSPSIPEPPTSGIPMTRSQLNKMREEGTGLFKRKAN